MEILEMQSKQRGIKIRYLSTLLVLILLSFTACNKKPHFNSFDKNLLSGNILLVNSFDNSEQSGLLLQDLATNDSKVILENTFFNWCSLGNDKKAIVAGGLSDNQIRLDLETNDYFELPHLGDVEFARYVPNKNELSYVTYRDRVLYTYDLDSYTRKEYIKNVDFHHTWKSDGSSFYYSVAREKIYEYNTITREQILCYEGYNPEMSPNDKYLAYLRDNSKNNILTIKDLSTGEDWEYEIYGVFRDFRFSPDSKYIVFIESMIDRIATFSTLPACVKVWDFKNNAFCILGEGYNGFRIDWK